MIRSSSFCARAIICLSKLIHGIGVYAGPIRNARAQLRTHAAQEASCRRRLCILRIVREDAAQILVVIGRPVPGEVFALFGVVLGKGMPQLAQRLDFALVGDRVGALPAISRISSSTYSSFSSAGQRL